MHLTDYREQTLQDVITHLESELFQKVTGLIKHQEPPIAGFNTKAPWTKVENLEMVFGAHRTNRSNCVFGTLLHLFLHTFYTKKAKVLALFCIFCYII